MSDEMKASEILTEMPEDPGFPDGDVGERMLDRMNSHHKPLRNWGFGFICWRPGMEILDVGCGGGAAIYEMLKLSEGSIVKGIDYSDKSIEMSERMNEEAIRYERCRIEKADVAKMPFIDEEFDLVTAIETLYFWPDPLAAMREIRRVLKAGGEAAVLMEACDPAESEPTRYRTPMRVYSIDEIQDLMKKAGFAETQAEHGDGENICVIGRKLNETTD